MNQEQNKIVVSQEKQIRHSNIYHLVTARFNGWETKHPLTHPSKHHITNGMMRMHYKDGR